MRLFHRVQARSNSALARFAEQEILDFSLDQKFALVASQMPHYTEVGRWASQLRGPRVLELGCGPGRYVPLLAANGLEVTAVDPFHFDTWALLENLRVELTDQVWAENLPFEPASFDGVSCLGALLYFEDPDKALQEMHRVLVPQGSLVLRTVNRNNFATRATGRPLDPASRNLYTADELRTTLTRNGFVVEWMTSYGFWPPYFGRTWWRLLNGPISIRAQMLLSRWTPAKYRVNLIAWARKP